jgi:hypothetical protein
LPSPKSTSPLEGASPRAAIVVEVKVMEIKDSSEILIIVEGATRTDRVETLIEELISETRQAPLV